MPLTSSITLMWPGGVASDDASLSMQCLESVVFRAGMTGHQHYIAGSCSAISYLIRHILKKGK
jgi:hypothetical protein